MNLKDLIEAFAGLSEANRPIRLRLSQERQVLDDVLLVKRVTGNETMCGGLEYRLLCVSTHAGLPLKEFITLPVELQFVTDRGDVRAKDGNRVIRHVREQKRHQADEDCADSHRAAPPPHR